MTMHMKSETQVVEEGWRAERLKEARGNALVSLHSFSLSAFSSGAEPGK
jgi:hypothetical protein